MLPERELEGAQRLHQEQVEVVALLGDLTRFLSDSTLIAAWGVGEDLVQDPPLKTQLQALITVWSMTNTLLSPGPDPT